MAKERDERNFYQMERDRIDTFWEVTRKELEETRAEVKYRHLQGGHQEGARGDQGRGKV